jgi:phenylacetate-coenzyme A ligase PaaK-like adenylate-forming protein
MKGQWNDKIFNVASGEFASLALEAFQFQYARIPIYKSFADRLGYHPDNIQAIEQIPFLPIRFFKSHIVQSTGEPAKLIFESSGTTQGSASRHFVTDPNVYIESFTQCFKRFYGDPSEWCILGLLPSYLERTNSSLVFMVNELIKQSGHDRSGFYLDEFANLTDVLADLEKLQQKTLLLGVSFGLLDFADYLIRKGVRQLPRQLIVMETGGMKGRREELVREELHRRLTQAFGVSQVHSEYGMTELLSQAYSNGDGLFQTPPWMKVLLREEDDPLCIRSTGESAGVINIIDLANINSCCFIATDDTGKIRPGNGFEVLGRLDHSDLRGCSLLAI